MDTENQPKITISLDPILEGYCRWIFNCAGKSCAIKINRAHKIGQHIYSHVRTSRKPYPRPNKNNMVVFTLPITENNVREFKTKRTYISLLDEEQIVDFISADFKVWCEHMFENGYLFKWEQKEIIDAILRGLSVRNNSDNYEAVKKNDYRNRRKKENKRFEMLLNNCYSVV